MAQALIMRRGGGGGINALKVTAVANYASLPASPTLYQMCIVSATAVNNVYVTNTAPASPAAGDVQIGTGYACNQPIYLDADGKVAAYPTNAYQYNGTAWVAVDLYTWGGTAWVPPWKYLVKSGINKTDMGGAFTATAGVIEYPAGAIEAYNNAAAEFRKQAAIDITPYRYLKMSGYKTFAGSGAAMYVRTSIAGASIATVTISTTNQIYTIDVSNYTGLMFFGFSINFERIRLTDWWLE